MTDNEQLSKNIAYLMNLRGYSRKEIAEDIGCSPDTVSNWTSGKTKVRKSYVVKISEIFGCTVKSLYTDKIVWKRIKKTTPQYRPEPTRASDLSVNEIIDAINDSKNLSLYDLKYIYKAAKNRSLAIIDEKRKSCEK